MPGSWDGAGRLGRLVWLSQRGPILPVRVRPPPRGEVEGELQRSLAGLRARRKVPWYSASAPLVRVRANHTPAGEDALAGSWEVSGDVPVLRAQEPYPSAQPGLRELWRP
jgi:hypothetical protein